MAIRTLVAGVMLTASAMAAPAASGTTGPAPGPTPPPDNKSLFVDLFTSPTAIGRYQRLLVDPATGNLLTGDALRQVTVMDYNNSPPFDPGDKGGKFVPEVAATFPLLVDLPISMVVAFLNPCSLLVPHTHPQVETIVVAQGSLQSGMLIENLVAPGHGSGEVVQNLTLFQGTVYPPGATHYQLNPTCEPTVFIASLASSDPGVTVNSHFINMNNNASGPAIGFPDKVTSAHELDEIRKNLPAGLVISLEQCMADCKGKY